jgi:hypothetical protein
MPVTEYEIGAAQYTLLILFAICAAKTVNLIAELKKWLLARKAWKRRQL